MKFEKGKSGNPRGKPKGSISKTTVEFKEALTNLLNYAAPEMTKWLQRVAEIDPAKALDHVGKLAEYIHPKLGRTEHTGAGGGPIEQRDVTKTDAEILAQYLTQTKGK